VHSGVHPHRPLPLALQRRPWRFRISCCTMERRCQPRQDHIHSSTASCHVLSITRAHRSDATDERDADMGASPEFRFRHGPSDFSSRFQHKMLNYKFEVIWNRIECVMQRKSGTQTSELEKCIASPELGFRDRVRAELKLSLMGPYTDPNISLIDYIACVCIGGVYSWHVRSPMCTSYPSYEFRSEEVHT